MTTRNILAGGGEPEGGSSPAPPFADGGSAADSGGRNTEGSGGGGAGQRAHAGEAGAAEGKIVRIRARVDPAADLECCRFPLTDLGNAERWRRRFGEDFRFCPEIGWFAWDKRRWALLSEEKDKIPARVMQSVFLTVRAIRNEAALVAASGYEAPIGLSDADLRDLERWAAAENTTSFEFYLAAMERDFPDVPGEQHRDWLESREKMDLILGKTLWSQKVAAWAKTSEGSGKLMSVAQLAKSFESVNIEPTAMDADRMAINVLNGTLRLVRRNVKRSSEEVAAGKSEWRSEWSIRKDPHDRGDLISKLAPVKYAPAARCADYDGFMERVQPDPHMRRFIHQWGGLSLTGDIGEHKLAFFHGGGRNGKGTWVELVAHLAGDYAGAVGVESLAESGGKRRGDQATPDLAELPGVRFLRVSEPEKGMAFNDGLVKQLTGGDPVKARFLNKGFFEFLPSFKITISGNNRPNVRDTSHGFWARMQLVPWGVTIPEDEIDRSLPETLREQSSGVLNRLLEGLLDWRNNGLIVPEAVRMATYAYRDQSDELGRFLAQCCLVSDADTDVRVGAKELFDVFEAWADQTGGAKWTMKGFKRAMEDRGFEQKASNGMKWLRVELRPGVSVEDVKAGRLPDTPDHGAVGDGGDAAPGGADDLPPGW